MVTASILGVSKGAARAAMTRAAGLLAVWILIAGADPADLPAAIVAAALAGSASLILHPPNAHRVRLLPLMRLVLRLLFESVLAGADVARRALDPKLPLNPGLIHYKSVLPAGPARVGFGTIMSLVPGTLPAGSTADGALLIHCLDITRPVTASLMRDEAVLRTALGAAPIRG